MKKYVLKKVPKEELLAESNRIFDLLFDMYKNNVKTDKYFHELVRENIKSEYIMYKDMIMNMIITKIPFDLLVSPVKGKIFLTNSEYSKLG